MKSHLIASAAAIVLAMPLSLSAADDWAEEAEQHLAMKDATTIDLMRQRAAARRRGDEKLGAELQKKQDALTKERAELMRELGQIW